MNWSDYTPDEARGRVREWIETALSGIAIVPEVEDWQIDNIVECARNRGIDPRTLRVWIFDLPMHDWSGGELVRWAIRRGFIASTPEDVAEEASNAKRVGELLKGVMNG